MEQAKGSIGTKLLSVVMAVALVTGLAPSLALIAPHEAYAAGEGLAAAQLSTQDEPETIVDSGSDVNWASLYGGDGAGTTDTFSLSQVNVFENAVVLDDGTVVTAGVHKDSSKNLGAALVFYGDDGTLSKEVILNSDYPDGFEKVIKTKDGGLVAVGYAGNGDHDFAGIVSEKEKPGNSDFDALICKFNAKGELQKAAAFGGVGKDMFRDVIELDDGSFVAVGYTSSTDGDMKDHYKTTTRDALVMNFSPNLSSSSVVDIIGGTEKNGLDEARSIIKGINGGYAVAGTGFSSDGDFEGLYKSTEPQKGDWFLALYDGSNDSPSLNMYGGASNDYLMSIDYDYLDADGASQTTPQGYVLVGYGSSTDGDFASINSEGADTAALMRVGADGKLREKQGVLSVASASKLYAEDVTSSPAGYLVTGRFTDELKVGNADSIASKGGEDIFTTFISKGDTGYDYGSVQTFGGKGKDCVRSITIDDNANVLLTGTTQSDEFEGVAKTGTSQAFIMSVPAESVTPEAAYTTQKAAGIQYRIQRVVNKILALPAVDGLTLNDASAVAAARFAYDALTSDQKAQVNNSATLTAAEKKLDEIKVTELNKQIEAAEAVQFGHTSLDVWKLLQTAIADAKALGSSATPLEVKATIEGLAKAMQDVSDFSNVKDVAFPTENGDYSLIATIYTESSFHTSSPAEFALSRQFDPNMKLVKSDAGLKLQLRYITPNIDMQKVLLDGVEATKTGFGPQGADGSYGSYLFEIALPSDFSLNADHKLSFSYDTGVPSLGDNGVMTHSVYLVNQSTAAWPGFTGVVAELGSAKTAYKAGSYSVPATLVKDDNESPSMAGGAFNSAALLTVAEDGSVTVEIGTKPLAVAGITAYADNVKVYQTAGTTGEAVAAEEVTTQVVNVEGTDITVPTTLRFAVPAAVKASQDIYVNLEAPGSPMPAKNARLRLGYEQLADASAAAVERVTSLISWLGGEIGPNEQATVEAASAAYEALTDEEKAAVPAASVTLLTWAKASVTLARTVASVTLSQTNFTYTGSALKPAVTVKAKDGSVIAASGYTVAYANNTNAGTATVTVTGVGAYTGTASTTFQIAQAESAIKLAATSVSKTFGDKAFALGASMSSGDNALSYKSSNTKVVTVDNNGKVTIKGAGTAKITVSAAQTANYKEAVSKTVSVSVAKKANTLKVVRVKATQKVERGKTTTIAASKVFKVKTNKSKGKVSYKLTSVTKKAKGKITLASNGKLTVKKGLAKGTYTVKAKATSAATANYKSATVKNITFKVKVG